ncbi:hypothetical protein [Escherichia phage IMM-001]|nr:hypothetical protein [Escherichia phage IMM-001]
MHHPLKSVYTVYALFTLSYSGPAGAVKRN